MSDDLTLFWLEYMYNTMPYSEGNRYQKLEALLRAIEVLKSQMQSNVPEGGADG